MNSQQRLGCFFEAFIFGDMEAGDATLHPDFEIAEPAGPGALSAEDIFLAHGSNANPHYFKNQTKGTSKNTPLVTPRESRDPVTTGFLDSRFRGKDDF